MFSKYVDNYFKNLNSSDKDILSINIEIIFHKICKSFHLLEETFKNQLFENSGRDLISLILAILPYFDTGKIRIQSLLSLKQLIDKPKKINNRKIDLGEETIEQYINENVEMLLKSIEICSNKLYVNWVTIRPISIYEYKNYEMYKKTKDYFDRKSNEPGIYIGDIFHSWAFDLFLNIKKVKWMLYEEIVNNRLLSYEELIGEIFNENTIFSDLLNSIKIGNLESYYFNAIKYALIFFENNYNLKEIKDYKKFKDIDNIDKEKEDDTENYDINKITPIEVYEKLNKIGEERWKSYLKDAKRIFSYTWYSKQKHIIDDNIEVSGESYFLTRKNIYHFAKNMCCKEFEKEYLQECFHWEELNLDRQNEIIKQKFFGENTDWFKISGYLRRIYGINDRNTIKQISEAIIKKIYDKKFIEIVFENLIYKGVLSEYNPVEQTKIDNKYKECYYYLTGQQFQNLMGGKYFEDVEKDNWKKIYALDFISQINFFHKVYHSRINYITGSTGVGKSTQSPKLLMYSMIMIYYKNSSKILCSQPRIAPTEENAIRIAKELGVPLEGDNFYMQYQHQEKSWTPDKREINSLDWTTLFIKILTDGSLLEQLKNNSNLLTEKGLTKYDIIIVDESHEHNPNMDLILTLMKQVMKYNLFIKLGIISATMDNDEPRYRLFYRDITDVKQIPYNLNYNRKFIDRRIHISPFGQTTRFKINDYYEKLDPKTYEETEAIATKKVFEILKKTNNGDILLFSIGSNNIKKIVTKLNKTLPLDVIAVPYYSELPDNYKDKIKVLTEFYKLFIYERIYLIDILTKYGKDWNNTVLPFPRFVGNYNRCIIVSTNIAEASITINSIKFVIDTGEGKVNYFDVKTGLETLKSTSITQSSKDQRRGRVGRVSDGDVFCIYTEASKSDIKQQYGICNKNLYGDLIELEYKNSLKGETPPVLPTQYQNINGLKLPEIEKINLKTFLDETGEFFITHPDEDKNDRDEKTGRFLKTRSNFFKHSYIHQILRSNHYYVHILRNVKGIIDVKEKINNNQVTFFTTVSLIIAFNFNKNVFTKVAYFIFANILKQFDEEVLSTIKFKKFILESKFSGKVVLSIEETIFKYYQIIENNKIYLPPITLNLNDNEKFAISLYFSNPLNIAKREGSEWYNLYSNAKLNTMSSYPSSYIYYHTKNIMTECIDGVFPINYNFGLIIEPVKKYFT